jgi:oligopeptide/dipeptide ABC transporter ATP-binding protein
MKGTVGLMYMGQIVEQAQSEELFNNPLHPYTRALISAVLPLSPDNPREEIVLQGEIPSLGQIPTGCRFHPRCPFVMAHCSKVEPVMKEVVPGHLVQCHLF